MLLLIPKAWTISNCGAFFDSFSQQDIILQKREIAKFHLLC